MQIGVPKEIKNHEYRVGLTVSAVAELHKRGHQVFVETGAGSGVGMSDADFTAAGAQILADAAAVFAQANLIVKVKEPLPQECGMLRPGQTLFTFLHLAASRELTEQLLRSGACCIAYETITDAAGRLPVLTPMSQIAGRLSVQAGAAHLEKHNGGRGVLLGGATGTTVGRVVIIGGGVVGSNACQIALGMGAHVVVLDRSINQLESLTQRFGRGLEVVYASTANIEQHAPAADLLIGAVLTAGRSADKVIPASLIKQMKTGAVMVDVAIDQGGSCENSRATTHADPTFVVDGVIHYCVSNMPGAVPVTASEALSNATLQYLLEMADQGVLPALRNNPHLRNGLNIIDGKLTNEAVASGFGLEYVDASLMLA
ncbi:MAG: alanine dehydrogenase [Pseudomonadales bacterium]|nr:alanine dehydrogenase [Pseudomonadales bacterium]